VRAKLEDGAVPEEKIRASAEEIHFATTLTCARDDKKNVPAEKVMR